MKQEKSYSFPLHDTSLETIVGVLSVTTTKTAKKFKKDYLKVRNNWFEEEFPDTLDNYLVEHLEKLGYSVSIKIYDIWTDYLDF